MVHDLCFFYEQLKEGESSCFEHEIDSSFLDLENDKELRPISSVFVKGKIWKMADWLFVEAYVKASFETTCSYCSDLFHLPIELQPWKHEVCIDDIKEAFLDLREPLREAILLEIPYFAQCDGTTCKNINEVKKYLMKGEKEQFQQPFKDL
jgi:uncharacterized metal-binding protein YceD (DUF177 family)